MFRASIAREQHEQLDDDDDGTNFTRESERLFCVKVSQESSQKSAQKVQKYEYILFWEGVWPQQQHFLCEI